MGGKLKRFRPLERTGVISIALRLESLEIPGLKHPNTRRILTKLSKFQYICIFDCVDFVLKKSWLILKIWKERYNEKMSHTIKMYLGHNDSEYTIKPYKRTFQNIKQIPILFHKQKNDKSRISQKTYNTINVSFWSIFFTKSGFNSFYNSKQVRKFF